jgi:hypothetical protein
MGILGPSAVSQLAKDLAVGEDAGRLGNDRDALVGVEAVASERVVENAACAVAVFGYASSDEAERGLRAFRRAALESEEKYVRHLLPAVNEVLRAGRFNVALRDQGLMPMAHDAVWKALRSKLELAAPGAVRSETLAPIPPPSLDAVLYVASAWLPEAFDVKVDAERLTFAPTAEGKPPEPTLFREREVTYSNAGGTIALAHYRGQDDVSGPIGPATLDMIGSPWLVKGQIVALRTSGDVRPATLAWFEHYLDGELAKVDPAVKRLETSPAPAPAGPAPAAPAPAKKEIRVTDIFPQLEELPPGFAIKAGSLQGEENFFGWKSEVLSADFVERGVVNVTLLRRPQGYEGTEKLVTDAFTHAKTPTLILSTKDLWLVELTAKSDVSVEGFADLEKLFQGKLERVGDGPVMRTQPPILRENIGWEDLLVPAARLPGGLVPTDDVAPVATFGETASDASVGYAKGASRVCLRMFRPLRTAPSAAELRRCRVAWLAGSVGVTLETRGEVAEATVEALARFVDRELAACSDTRGARRLEIPAAPLLSAEEMVPTADKIPSWLEIVSGDERTSNASELSTAGEGLGLTLRPLLGAVNKGAEKLVRLAFRERGEMFVDVRSYHSVALAEEAFEATKRARAAPEIFDHVREVLVAGNVIAMLDDRGITVPGYDLVRRLLVERLERAGPVRVERFELDGSLPELRVRLAVPERLCPEGFPPGPTGGATEEWNKDALLATLFEGSDASVKAPCWQFSASGSDGRVELAVIAAGAGRRLPEPTPDRVKPCRSLWIFAGGKAAVALRTKGTVPEDVVRFFAKHVEAELSRRSDGKDAKRFDAVP